MNNRGWHKRLLGAATIALVALLGAGCAGGGSEPNKQAEQTANAPQKPMVRAGAVETRSIGEPVEVVAEVASSAKREVVLKTNGEVLKVYKKRGDHVRQGELLFELDPADTLLQKQKAELTLRGAQENLKNGKWANPDDFEALRPLEDEVQVAQIGMKEIQRTLENFKVTASISGILTEFGVEKGMWLSPGVVGEVQQLDPAKIVANITEENVALIRGKQELAFYETDRPDLLIRGKIVFLADIMDTKTRTYTLELEAANAEKTLKPGSKVQLRLTEEAEQEVLTVPSTAIVREESDTFVYVYAQGKVEKRAVKLGRLNGGFQEVLEGLTQGEQVVVSGQHQLQDGQEADIIQDTTS